MTSRQKAHAHEGALVKKKQAAVRGENDEERKRSCLGENEWKPRGLTQEKRALYGKTDKRAGTMSATYGPSLRANEGNGKSVHYVRKKAVIWRESPLPVDSTSEGGTWANRPPTS